MFEWIELAGEADDEGLVELDRSQVDEWIRTGKLSLLSL